MAPRELSNNTACRRTLCPGLHPNIIKAVDICTREVLYGSLAAVVGEIITGAAMSVSISVRCGAGWRIFVSPCVAE